VEGAGEGSSKRDVNYTRLVGDHLSSAAQSSISQTSDERKNLAFNFAFLLRNLRKVVQPSLSLTSTILK
jgi:hypothetical protein